VLRRPIESTRYASAAHRGALAAAAMLASMSGKGDCYGSAVAESFFSKLELELLQQRDWHTRTEVRRSVFRYIETWYNGNAAIPHWGTSAARTTKLDGRTLRSLSTQTCPVFRGKYTGCLPLIP
jgi:hypothetical protein